MFYVAGDPVKLGLVAGLARPGGNATGVNNFAAELGAKHLGVLRELLPTAARIGLMVNPTNPNVEGVMKDVTAAALTAALDGQAIISPDCVPLGLQKMNSNFQERIIAILQGSPNGLTANEIAERLGATAGDISSRLSKLAPYGIIGKTRYSRGPRGNVYRH